MQLASTLHRLLLLLVTEWQPSPTPSSLRCIALGDRDAECDSEGGLEASKSIFARNRIEAATPPVVVRDGSLRQRGGVVAPVEIKESLLQPDQDAPVRGDSMSLFATLVPPPLRKSKKNFTSGE